MRFRSYVMIALVATAALIGGCRTAPVYNVDNSPVTTTTSNVSADQVRDAIIRAGASLGWQMKEVQPGLIVGTLNLRSHMAQVDITYDAKAYSIQYKNSSNLRYNSEERVIHSNYNGWVQRLDQTIQNRLVAL